MRGGVVCDEYGSILNLQRHIAWRHLKGLNSALIEVEFYVYFDENIKELVTKRLLSLFEYI